MTAICSAVTACRNIPAFVTAAGNAFGAETITARMPYASVPIVRKTIIAIVLNVDALQRLNYCITLIAPPKAIVTSVTSTIKIKTIGEKIMSINELDRQVKQLRALRSMEAEVRSEIAAIEDSLKTAMLIAKTDTLTGRECVVTWKTIESSRFDTKNFKLSHAELYARFSVPTTSRRLVIA